MGVQLEFIDDQHHKRFQELMNQPHSRTSPEYQTAYYLLSLIDRPVTEYISKYGMEFASLIEDSKNWEESERALIQLANSLFCGVMEHKADVHDVFKYLRSPYNKAAIQAIRYRYQIED